MNEWMPMNSSVIPRQWSNANFLPDAKVSAPKTPSNFWPISITSVLSRTLEWIVVRDFIYLTLHSPPPHLDFTDQFAFQPGSSITVALIHLLHNITTMLETNPFVIVIAADFSKALNSVRHSTLVQKYASLELQDNIYGWRTNSRIAFVPQLSKGSSPTILKTEVTASRVISLCRRPL